ncbi:MAG: hypothetical protein MMC33_001505 [Icmadophila ericetorum]|nr:hypothetical protein [Icmadophila ericetorum]
MALTDFASWTPFNSNQHDLAVLSSAFLSSLALYVLYRLCRPTPSTTPISSPLKTLIPSLETSEIAQLPYPPDTFPGARDVASQYGRLRVYEWGSEDKHARKVVLASNYESEGGAVFKNRNGIWIFETNAKARDVYRSRGTWVSRQGLSRYIAGRFGLVQSTSNYALSGARPDFLDTLLCLMICAHIFIDLWGRGYSDAPVNVPHTTALYASMILIAITSSSRPWTEFTLIGYSFGGGISASFASHFPHLVSNLVLIAPSGLIRDYHLGKVNRILYAEGNLPEILLEWLVARRLGSGPLRSEAVKDKGIDAGVEAAAIDSEIPDKVTAKLSRSYPGLDVAKSVVWQVQKHKGFTKAFISSIRHGPIGRQYEDWRRIGERMSEDKVTGRVDPNKKVLIVLGKTDSIIFHDELIEDATALLGKDNVTIHSCNAGHDVPMEKSKEIVQYIYELWEC